MQDALNQFRSRFSLDVNVGLIKKKKRLRGNDQCWLVDVLVPPGKRVLKEKFYALKSTFIQNKNTEKSEQIS